MTTQTEEELIINEKDYPGLKIGDVIEIYVADSKYWYVCCMHAFHMNNDCVPRITFTCPLLLGHF